MENFMCPHCGPTPVSHRFEKFGAFLGRVLSPLHNVAAVFLRLLAKPVSLVGWDWLFLLFLKFLVLIRFASFAVQWKEPMSHRTQVIWEEAKNRGIDFRVVMFLAHPTDLIIAKFKGSLMIFDALPRPKGKRSKSLEWMDNKGLMREHFTEAGLPVARGGEFILTSSALKSFRQSDKPVIVKPSEGSRSRHTTINITTEEHLKDAIKIARQLSPWVIMEEQLDGFVHRATVIGGKVIAVMRRDPPHVYGDGVHSLMELVDLENKNPKRHDGIFHELETGGEADIEVKRHGLTWQNVLENGQFVSLHPKVGRSSGATNADVTDKVHTENIELFERIAVVLDDPLVGIDFIIRDVSKSWKGQKKSGVIECNSLPFIDLHHYPFEGPVRNAAAALWDVVLPESKSQKVEI